MYKTIIWDWNGTLLNDIGASLASVNDMLDLRCMPHIDADFYKNKDIHIHATEAAVPKDGPSAGVTIVTALVSALTGKKIKRDIAMTGEVTLRGRVLKIGGLREKAMAAYRGGVKTVFMPFENLSDLDEIDTVVKENVSFVPVCNVGEILQFAFIQEETEPQDNRVFEKYIATQQNRVSQ